MSDTLNIYKYKYECQFKKQMMFVQDEVLSTKDDSMQLSVICGWNGFVFDILYKDISKVCISAKEKYMLISIQRWDI
jgi:hypothetical protein